MARTRAGTSALFTINALATGVQPYTAAQGLAELLTMSGCEADILPNIDALKSMVTHLAPFLSETSLSKAFEQVTTQSQKALLRCCLNHADLSTKIQVLENRLRPSGEPQAWAKALRQLILTSKRKEKSYLLTKQRGAWLAAYASHILRIAVKLLCNDQVLWESAGECGEVTFE